jgi:transposase
MAADNRCAIGFILSGGESSDARYGRLLPDTIGRIKDPDEARPVFLLMDRAYEGWETRWLAFEWGHSPVVAPKKNRKEPWGYDREFYKKRNEVERMFRRIWTKYDKPDVMFSGPVTF